jgi:hypothetical protein
MTLAPATLKVTGAALLIFAAGVVTGSFTTATFKAPRRDRPQKIQAQATPGPTSIPEALPPSPPALMGGSPTNRRPERVSTRPPGWQRFEALRRLEDQIQLAPEQRDRIRSLIRDSEQRIRSDWEPLVPRIQTEIRELRRKISAELTPEQRERFDALFERREQNQTPREVKGPRRTNSAPEALR